MTKQAWSIKDKFYSKKISLYQESRMTCLIGHFTVVYLVAKPLIWSEAEGDLVVLETRI